MPKKNVIEPITDQEIIFARFFLSGTMTDRQAAEAAGLSPDAAVYTKAKPRVQAYLLEHGAAINERLAQREDSEKRRHTLSREQVLSRLWAIANLDPEGTRNNATAQMKALSMIVAIGGLVPERGAVEKQPPAPPAKTKRHKSS